MQSRNAAHNRWAVILAGGDGKRLSDMSCRIAGRKTPKQYCQIVGDQSLIEQTRRRVELAIAKDQIFYALSRRHERCYLPLLPDVSPARRVVQPVNRGTAPAVLYSLMRLRLVDPDAHVALFPCDHYVSDDSLFMLHVCHAFEAITDRPELIAVLGITPDAPETEYGWIEPASPIPCGSHMLFHVSRFLEKPPIEMASKMWEGGRCFWNSFVLVARVSNLLALMARALPELYRIFAEASEAFATEFEREAVERIYRAIATVEFCGSVLTTYARDSVSVLPVSGVYWNDLGNPSRVMKTIAHLGLRPQWAQ